MLREVNSFPSVGFEEQIKHIFFTTCGIKFDNWGIPLGVPSFSWGILSRETCSGQSRASGNIGWIIIIDNSIPKCADESV